MFCRATLSKGDVGDQNPKVGAEDHHFQQRLTTTNSHCSSSTHVESG